MENLKPEEQPNIEDIKGTGLNGSEKPSEPRGDLLAGKSATGEELKKWTPEEKQDIKTKADKIFEKRMRGEAPYEHEKIDKILDEKRITPWTPEAQKFMEKWDWLEAEKEYAQMKGAGKEEKKEEPKIEAKEEIKTEETPAEITPEALVAAGVVPEVAKLPEQVPATEEAVVAEVAKLPEEVRQRVGFSLANMGYWIERWKGESLASAVEKAQNKLNPQERSLTDNFLSAIREKSARDAEVADKKMQDMEKNKQALRTAGSAGFVGKNIYNIARPIADYVGWTATLPLRYVSIVAAGVAATYDIFKEMRLKEESAVNKTRIQDIDAAMEEAVRVYEKAGGVYDFEKGGNGVGKEALKEAYLKDMAFSDEKTPGSIRNRLSLHPESGILGRITNGVFRKHIEKSIGNLNSKIAKIDARTDWSQAKKDYKKERVFNNYRKRIADFDRMLGQAGAVDTTAMLAKYGDYAGKAVVAATAALMLKPAWDKFSDWLAGGTADRLPDIVGENGPSWEELLGIDLKDGLSEEEAQKILKYMGERSKAGDGATVQQILDRYGDIKITGTDKTFEEWFWEMLNGGKAPPKVTIPWEDLIDNKGVIGHDSIWQSTKHIVEAHAKEMGYTGDLNDVAALDKWAETQTANLVNKLAETQGGKVKDLVHGGPDIGEYDKIIVQKVNGEWTLEFKAESGIEPGYLPAQAGLPEKPKISEEVIGNRQDFTPNQFEQPAPAAPEASPVASETPPQEISLPESAPPEPARSELEKTFEALSGEKERQAFVYDYLINTSKTTGLDLSNEKAWVFSRTFGKTMSHIDTSDELREALTNFDYKLNFTREVLAKGELPISDKVIFVVENAKGQIFNLEHPTKDVYRVVKQLPDGKSQYIGNGWLNRKDWSLKAVKKFLGY